MIGSRMEGRSLKQWRTKDNVIRGTLKGRTCKKRRQTQPRCNSEIKDWGMKQWPLIGRGKTFIEALGQTFGLEVIETGSWIFD
jgi:hypothetical protein